MKTSTTLPYLSKRGKRSSAVVPTETKKENKSTKTQKENKSELKNQENQIKCKRQEKEGVNTKSDVEDKERVCVPDVWRS